MRYILIFWTQDRASVIEMTGPAAYVTACAMIEFVIGFLVNVPIAISDVRCREVRPDIDRNQSRQRGGERER
jgi:hypothetical protein